MSETDDRASMTAPIPERPDLTRDQFSNDESYYLATGRRTAPTPDQMRALADEGSDYAGMDEYPGAVLIRDLSAALRAAADQNQGENGMMSKPLSDFRGLDDPAPERCPSVLYVAEKQRLTRCHGTVRHIGTHWAGASTIWSDEEATYYLVSDD